MQRNQVISPEAVVQNAAFVEQSPAAARSLKELAEQWAEVVSRFKLADDRMYKAPLLRFIS